MLINIDAQHEEVLKALSPYWDEVVAWRSYVMRFTLRHPLRFFTLVLPVFLARRRRTPSDLLSGKADQAIAQIVRKIYVGERDAEAAQRLDDLLGDFSVHIIAERVLSKFPDYDFAKIKKLHDARRTDRLRLTMNKLLTVVLTVAAFMGKSVPKVVVEEDFQLKYADYERGLFYTTCVLLAYAGLLVFSEWFALRRIKEKHEYLGRILSYIDLASAKAKTA